MNNKIVLVVVAIAAAGTGYFLRHADTDSVAAATTPVAADAPRVEFALPDLSGETRSIADWDGEARLINFWATWCAPCRREIPLLKDLQADKERQGLQVIGVAVDFTEDVLDYAEEAEFNYPVLVGQEEAMDAAEQSGVEFIGLPFTLVVTADGQLVNTHVGEIKAQHIKRISSVMHRLGAGDIDLEAARKALEHL